MKNRGSPQHRSTVTNLKNPDMNAASVFPYASAIVGPGRRLSTPFEGNNLDSAATTVAIVAPSPAVLGP